MPFSAVLAKGREARLEIGGEAAAAMTLWSLPGTDGMISTGAYRRGMAEAAASAIQSWLVPDGAQQAGLRQPNGSFVALRPADIAILVRNRTEAEAIRKSLSQRKLASVYLCLIATRCLTVQKPRTCFICCVPALSLQWIACSGRRWRRAALA